MGTALDFMSLLGLDRVEARCRALSDYLKEGLTTLPGMTLLSGPDELSAPGSTISSSSLAMRSSIARSLAADDL